MDIELREAWESGGWVEVKRYALEDIPLDRAQMIEATVEVEEETFNLIPAPIRSDNGTYKKRITAEPDNSDDVTVAPIIIDFVMERDGD